MKKQQTQMIDIVLEISEVMVQLQELATNPYAKEIVDNLTNRLLKANAELLSQKQQLRRKTYKQIERFSEDSKMHQTFAEMDKLMDYVETLYLSKGGTFTKNATGASSDNNELYNECYKKALIELQIN
jgi:hypothetical protein